MALTSPKHSAVCGTGEKRSIHQVAPSLPMGDDVMLMRVDQKREWFENVFKKQANYQTKPPASHQLGCTELGTDLLHEEPGHELVQLRHRWIEEELLLRRSLRQKGFSDQVINNELVGARRKWFEELQQKQPQLLNSTLDAKNLLDSISADQRDDCDIQGAGSFTISKHDDTLQQCVDNSLLCPTENDLLAPSPATLAVEAAPSADGRFQMGTKSSPLPPASASLPQQSPQMLSCLDAKQSQIGLSSTMTKRARVQTALKQDTPCSKAASPVNRKVSDQMLALVSSSASSDDLAPSANLKETIHSDHDSTAAYQCLHGTCTIL
jgi:hypothetical protein